MVHEPRLDTILMVEKAILDINIYPKRMELYRSLPRKVHYSTYKRIIDYLEASGKIIFNSDKIVYTGLNSETLRKFVETSVSARDILGKKK